MATTTCNLTDTAHGGKVLTTANGGSSSRTLGLSGTSYAVTVDFYGYGGYDGKSHTYVLGFDKDAYNSSAGTTFEATASFTTTLNDGSPSADSYQYLGSVSYSNASGFSNYRIGVQSHSTSGGGQLVITRVVVTTTTGYTLTVSAGSHIASVSGGGTYAPGAKPTITATLGSATGYTYGFSKWTSNNGGTFANASSASTTFTMPAANVTVTATGTKTAKQYALTVKYQNGIADFVTDGSSSKPHLIYGAQNWNHLSGALTRDGYTFTGYYDAPSGGIQVYDTDGYRLMGTTYWDSSGNYCYAGDMTVYAQWTENYLTVTHNINNGEQDPAKSSSYPVTNGAWSYNYKYSNNAYISLYNVDVLGFKRAGYVAKPGAEWIYGNSITIDQADETLTTGQLIAQKLGKDLTSGNASASVLVNWSKAPITLTYDANGGLMPDGNASSVETQTYGNLITPPIPTRAGYNFKGWYIDFDGSNYVNYGADYKYTDRLSVHLTAYMDNWADFWDNNYRLISCTETGGWGIEPLNGFFNFSAYSAADSAYKSATSPVEPAFLDPGWHNFDIVFPGVGESVQGYIDGELVATGEPFTGGIGYNALNSIFLGAEAAKSQTDPTPENPYFIGKIGNVIISNTNTVYSIDTYDKITVPAEDVTFYARWEEIPEFTVSFDPNGATGEDLTPYTKIFTYSEEDSLEIPDPYNLNLFLFGNTPKVRAEWNSEPDGTGYSLAALQTETSTNLEALAQEKNGNLIFYLNWRPAGKACIFTSNTNKVFAYPWYFDGRAWTKCMVYIYDENSGRWFATVEPLGSLENYQIIYPNEINIYAKSDSDEFYPTI